MIVKPAPSFTDPYLFLISGRPLPGDQVEPVGVLIIKQGVNLDGTRLPMPQPQPPESPLQILVKDVPFAASEQIPRNAGESDDEYMLRALSTKYESDLAVIKPNVDLLFVRDWNNRNVLFGYVWINPNGAPGARFKILRGLRERTDALRVAKTGDAGGFIPVEIPDPQHLPPLAQRLDLPNGFDARFFQMASCIIDEEPPPVDPLRPIDAATGPALQAGDVVAYAESVSDPQEYLAEVTIPAAPVLKFRLNGKSISPVFRSSGVDTVLLDWNLTDAGQRRFLLTWRFVFAWETRFELATVEVS